MLSYLGKAKIARVTQWLLRKSEVKNNVSMRKNSVRNVILQGGKRIQIQKPERVLSVTNVVSADI